MFQLGPIHKLQTTLSATEFSNWRKDALEVNFGLITLHLAGILSS